MIGAADPENRLKPLTPAICCRVALAARDSRRSSYASFGSLEATRATHLHNRIMAPECRIVRLDRGMTYAPQISRRPSFNGIRGADRSQRRLCAIETKR